MSVFSAAGDRRRNTLSSFIGEFTNPEQEAGFRASVWADWHHRVRVVIVVGVVAFLITTLADYLLLGASLPFSLIVAGRALVVAYGLGFIAVAGRRRSPFLSDLGLLIFLVLLTSVFLGTVAARPDGLRYSGPACVLILFIFYTVPMTRMWITLTNAIYLSLGMLMVAAWVKQSSPRDIGVFGVQFLAANLIGYFIALRLHQDIRRAWVNLQSLQMRERQQRLLASLSSQFLNVRPEQFENIIAQAFKSICEYTLSDRVYLMEFDASHERASMTHEWCAEGIPQTKTMMQNFSAGLMPWTSLKMQRGEIVQADRVRDLPPEAASERDFYIAQGVQSFLCVPLTHEGLLLGMIGLDCVRGQRSWDADTVSLLRFIGQVVFNALRRSHAEENLRSRESHLQTLTTLSPVGIFQTDADGYYQYVNERWTSLTGLPRELALGNRWRQGLHPDDAERVSAAWAYAVAHKTDFNDEHRCRRPDGSVIWVHGRARPQLHSDGHVLGFVGTIDDITERKQAHLEIEQRVRMDQFVTSLTVRFLQQDETGMDNAIRRALADVGEFAGADRCGYFTVDAGKGTMSCQYTWLRSGPQDKDLGLENLPIADYGWAISRILRGEVVNVPRISSLPAEARGERKILEANLVQSLRLVPILSTGQVIGYVSITATQSEMDWSADITLVMRIAGEMILNALQRLQTEQSQRLRTQELERLNLTLERRNADLQKLAYVASHDLQEPLRTVSSFSSLLAQNYRGRLDEHADEYIRYITDATARLHSLISDLLAYTRVDNQVRPPVECDMNEIAQIVLDNLSETMQSLGARIDCARLPTLHAEPLQMIQLVQHLVANALRFHGENPPYIEIRAEHTDSEWVFSVADNGIGIAPKHAERVFEIFQRLHPSGHYPGTGIGLPVCRRIVERHGGRIWVEPNLPQGSVFRWTLPLSLSVGGDRSAESRHAA